MVKHSSKKPQLVFALIPLQPSHLLEVAAWASIAGIREEGRSNEEILRERLYAVFRRHYRPLWHSGEVSSYVMTVNRRPVFCLSLLRMGRPGETEKGGELYLYMLCSPPLRRNARLLLLAWQAASTFVFLRLGPERVQVAVDEDSAEENEALVTLGYRLIEISQELGGKKNVYVCDRGEYKLVM